MKDLSYSAARRSLAVLGGFVKPEPRVPNGANRAAYWSSISVARSQHYDSVHAFHDSRALPPGGSFDVPPGSRVEFHDRRTLVSSLGMFDGVLSVETEWEGGIPHALRPFDDWTPVVCEVGTSHSQPQWMYLFWALRSGLMRPSDGLVFKSGVTRRVFASILDDWAARFGPLPQFQQFVIPQAVPTQIMVRDTNLHAPVRAFLGIEPNATVFLAFSRLSPASKGDPMALLVLWREVARQSHDAVLVYAGAMVERRFTEQLHRLVRELDITRSVRIIANPHELWAEPGHALMSAADVLIHPSTGIEEVASLVVCEAMAHGLPVVAADWSGMREVIRHGENGVLIPTRATSLPHELQRSNSMAVDPAYNAELSRTAVMDAAAARISMVALAQARDRRLAMGQAARKFATDVLDIDKVAQARETILDDCATMARNSWRDAPAVSVQPLVNLDIVVSTLASSVLDEHTRVRVDQTANLPFVPEWRAPHTQPLVSMVVQHAAAQQSITLGDLITHATHDFALPQSAGRNSHSPDDRLSGSFMRICARLVAFGVFSVEDPPQAQAKRKPDKTAQS